MNSPKFATATFDAATSAASKGSAIDLLLILKGHEQLQVEHI